MHIQHNYMRMHRRKARLGQTDIAHLASLSDHSTVSRWENGTREPGLEILLIYHLLFDTPIEDIFKRQKEEMQSKICCRISSRIDILKKLPKDNIQDRVFRICFKKANSAYGAKPMTVKLALYPNARGLGYACLELPSTLIEYGIVNIRPVRNDKTLERMEKFIDFFKPEIVIVRDAEVSYAVSQRMEELLEGLRKIANVRKLPVHSYTRKQVNDVFEVFGAKTKYGIAQKITTWFPDLREHAPRIRRPWMEEPYYMGVFNALALAICHAYLDE